MGDVLLRYVNPPSLPSQRRLHHTHTTSLLASMLPCFCASIDSLIMFHTYVHLTFRRMESKVLGPHLHFLIALSITHIFILNPFFTILCLLLSYSSHSYDCLSPYLSFSFLFTFSPCASLHRDADYDEFEAMLHGLSVSRPLIKAAMGFAFDKVESAKEVLSCHVMSCHVM